MTRFAKFLTGAAILAVTIVAIAGVGVWYQFFNDDAPPPVSLESAVENLDSLQAAATPAPSESTATAPPVTDSPDNSAPTVTPEAEVAATELSPVTVTQTPDQAAESASENTVWNVDSTGDSFVGYRVGEELARIGTAEGVGRTSSVTGSVTLDGSTITEGTIDADLTNLQSDDSRRDRALQSQSLETNVFPTASFQMTGGIELGEIPADDVTFNVTAVGDLTLHGVTRPVEIPLEAVFSNSFLVVVGSLEIQFADYEISPPSSPAVLSVNDYGTMEFQLVFSAEQV